MDLRAILTIFAFSVLQSFSVQAGSVPAGFQITRIKDNTYLVTLPTKAEIEADVVLKVFLTEQLSKWPAQVERSAFIFEKNRGASAWTARPASEEAWHALIQGARDSLVTHFIRNFYQPVQSAEVFLSGNQTMSFPLLIRQLLPLMSGEKESGEITFSPRRVFNTALLAMKAQDVPVQEHARLSDPGSWAGYGSVVGAGPAGHTSFFSRLGRTTFSAILFAAGYGIAYRFWGSSPGVSELAGAGISAVGGAVGWGCAYALERLYNRRY